LNHEELMELILDHYEHPRNYGEIDGASLTQEGGNPGCGDLITVYMDMSRDGVIENASFKGEGCMVSMAGTSIILEKLKGKTVCEVAETPTEMVSSILGKRLVATRHNCAYLGLNTLKKAAIKWRREKMLDSLK
jgi:nitrogen fixation protein NifU and related proteins